MKWIPKIKLTVDWSAKILEKAPSNWNCSKKATKSSSTKSVILFSKFASSHGKRY